MDKETEDLLAGCLGVALLVVVGGGLLFLFWPGFVALLTFGVIFCLLWPGKT